MNKFRIVAAAIFTVVVAVGCSGDQPPCGCEHTTAADTTLAN